MRTRDVGRRRSIRDRVAGWNESPSRRDGRKNAQRRSAGLPKQDPALSTAQVFTAFRKAMSCEIADEPKCRQDQVKHTDARVIDLIEHDALVKNAGTRKLQAFLEKLSSGRLPHARGLRFRCSKIGDMLIALACPKGATIVIADGSFEELGRITGRKVEIVPSLETLRAERRARDAA
jgi:hypothetical protein